MYKDFYFPNHYTCIKEGNCTCPFERLVAVATVHREEMLREEMRSLQVSPGAPATPGAPTTTGVFKCRLCPRSFSSGQGLGGHSGSHPQCKICSKRLLDERAALAHQQTHFIPIQLQCPSCLLYFRPGEHRNCDVVVVPG